MKKSPKFERHEIFQLPNLQTVKECNKWLETAIHAVHLGFIDKEKLKVIYNIQLVASETDKSSEAKHINRIASLLGLPQTWIGLTFGMSNQMMQEFNVLHDLCWQCGVCACGCGKTEKQFISDKLDVKRSIS